MSTTYNRPACAEASAGRQPMSSPGFTRTPNLLLRKQRASQSDRRGDLVSGFTLIETLIALTVLTVALVAPMQLAYQALKSARTTEAQITSFYLAQEGVEFVKNIRDTNMAAGTAWLTNLGGAQGCINQWCEFDPDKNNFSAGIKKCSGSTVSGCDEVKYDSSTNTYGFTGSVSTGIQRGMFIDDRGYEAEITVTVRSTVEGVTKETTVAQTIYNIDEAQESTVPICGNAYCEVGEEPAGVLRCDADCGVGGGGTDTDGDTVPDTGDNCWCEFNLDQADAEPDGTGNVCDYDRNGTDFAGCCSASCGQ